MKRLYVTKEPAELMMAYIIIVMYAWLAWMVFGDEVLAGLRIVVAALLPPAVVCVHQFLFGFESDRRQRDGREGK